MCPALQLSIRQEPAGLGETLAGGGGVSVWWASARPLPFLCSGLCPAVPGGEGSLLSQGLWGGRAGGAPCGSTQQREPRVCPSSGKRSSLSPSGDTGRPAPLQAACKKACRPLGGKGASVSHAALRGTAPAGCEPEVAGHP